MSEPRAEARKATAASEAAGPAKECQKHTLPKAYVAGNSDSNDDEITTKDGRRQYQVQVKKAAQKAAAKKSKKNNKKKATDEEPEPDSASDGRDGGDDDEDDPEPEGEGSSTRKPMKRPGGGKSCRSLNAGTLCVEISLTS